MTKSGVGDKVLHADLWILSYPEFSALLESQHLFLILCLGSQTLWGGGCFLLCVCTALPHALWSLSAQEAL